MPHRKTVRRFHEPGDLHELTFSCYRRMPLLANSFMQFLSPTMQFLVAVFLIGETMSAERWVAIGFVWAAVLVFVGDALVQVRAKRRKRSPPALQADSEGCSRPSLVIPARSL